MNPSNAMNFIKPTMDILDIFKTLLEAVETPDNDPTFNNVAIYPGTNEQKLFEYIPELQLPAAVIFHSSSKFANYPRRTLTVSVFVICEAFNSEDKTAVRNLLDKAVEALDQEVVDSLLIKADKEHCLELVDSPQLAATKIIFAVEDH